MPDWIASGRIVDVVIAVTIVEAVMLIALHRRTGRGLAPADVLGTLAAGLCLMLALRAALTGAAWGWIVLWIALSGVFHAIDMARRWR